MMSQDLMPSYALEGEPSTPPEFQVDVRSPPGHLFHTPIYSPNPSVSLPPEEPQQNSKAKNTNQTRKRSASRPRSTSTARQKKTPAPAFDAASAIITPPIPSVAQARGRKADEQVKKINETTDRLEQKIEYLASKVLTIESILEENGHFRETAGNGFLNLVEAYNKKVLAESGNIPGSDQQRIARIISDYRKQSALLDQRVVTDIKSIIQGVQAQVANEIQSNGPEG